MRGGSGTGALGLTLPQVLLLNARAGRPARVGQASPVKTAKSCIVLFAWGGMSHLDTWDPKPDASADIRGEFRPIPTSVPGIHISEHLPLLARKMHQLAVVRSVHHLAPSHRSAAYWNLTGQPPPTLTANWEATRNDHPGLGAMTLAAMEASQDPRLAKSVLRGTVALPYSLADDGRINGQDGGFLGLKYDPIIVRPSSGIPYGGKSPPSSSIDLTLPPGVDRTRLAWVRELTQQLESATGVGSAADTEPLSVPGRRPMICCSIRWYATLSTWIWNRRNFVNPTAAISADRVC